MQENLVQKIVEEVLQQVLKINLPLHMTVKFRLVYLPAMSILHKQKWNSFLVKIISLHRSLSFHNQGNLLRRKL